MCLDGNRIPDTCRAQIETNGPVFWMHNGSVSTVDDWKKTKTFIRTRVRFDSRLDSCMTAFWKFFFESRSCVYVDFAVRVVRRLRVFNRFYTSFGNSFGMAAVHRHGSERRFRQRSITGKSTCGKVCDGRAHPFQIVKPTQQCVEMKNTRFIRWLCDETRWPKLYVRVGIPLNHLHALLATESISICGFLCEIRLFAHVLVGLGP